MKLLTSLALAGAGVSATTVNDKCLICSHVGFADSEENAIKGKRLMIIDIEHNLCCISVFSTCFANVGSRLVPYDNFGFDFSYHDFNLGKP